MARVKPGKTTRRRHHDVLSATRGHRGSRSRRYRAAKESLVHALDYATWHRRLFKRQQRSLAVLRINAAARSNGMSYSQLIHGLREAGIELDRKSLSELAIREPQAFSAVVGAAKAALPA